MPNTPGFHPAKSGFGLRLPEDARGSWSEAWDEQIGHYEAIRGRYGGRAIGACNLFDESCYCNVKSQIERHNIRRGVRPRPYSLPT